MLFVCALDLYGMVFIYFLGLFDVYLSSKEETQQQQGVFVWCVYKPILDSYTYNIHISFPINEIVGDGGKEGLDTRALGIDC